MAFLIAKYPTHAEGLASTRGGAIVLVYATGLAAVLAAILPWRLAKRGSHEWLRIFAAELCMFAAYYRGFVLALPVGLLCALTIVLIDRSSRLKREPQG